MRKMKNLVTATNILALIFITSCSTKNPGEVSAPVKFRVIAPLVKDTAYIKEYVAEITAFQNVEIRSKVAGFIESISVDEGQTVQKGQLLFTISNKQFQQDVLKAAAVTKSARAELKAAEIELDGAKKLLDKNFISQSEYGLTSAKAEILRAKLEEAKSDEAQANLNLSFAQVKAPFDGIINRIPNKVGSLVEEGAWLTTISNNNEVFAYFNVSEKEYTDYAVLENVEPVKEVTLVLANGMVYSHAGLIETSESEFNKSTGTIAFRAKFPNPQRVLKHGATAKVQIKTPIKNAMLIPQKSTLDRQEHLCVYTINEDSIVQVKKIIPLVRLPQSLVIGQGLNSNDRIIYEGAGRIEEGDKITPEMYSLEQVFKQ
jgi:RND family efflux transporter MFP subunit